MMKATLRLYWIAVGLVLGIVVFPQAGAVRAEPMPTPMGVVIFNNNSGSKVIDGTTGEPVAPGIAVAGLYFCTNLFAAPDPSAAPDAFELAAITPVSPANFALRGYFNGGTISIPGTTPGQHVLLQVRVWTVDAASFEEAYGTAGAWTAVSALVGPVRLGGGIMPPNSLSVFPMGNLILLNAQGNNRPVGHSLALTVLENTTARGQLTGSDYEGNPLTYELADPPSKGTVMVQSNGSFTYTSHLSAVGEDAFTFRVNDGEANSLPAIVRLTIEPSGKYGIIRFGNGPESRVVDSGTGLPVEPGQFVAGLYLTTNLNAIPNPSLPRDEFVLAATVPVSVGADPALWGLFDFGILVVLGTIPGQEVLAQIRIWSAAFATYEEAMLQSTALVAVSDLLGPVVLGGGAIDIPDLAEIGFLRELALVQVAGNEPPSATDAHFTIKYTTTLTATLAAYDPEGRPLTYILVSSPVHGTISILDDGQFTYVPYLGNVGKDSFTFKVSDGVSESETATVSITLIPPDGTIYFSNSSQTRVIDASTGLPVAPGLVVAGLYYSTNLSAAIDPTRPTDDLVLAAITSLNISLNINHYQAFWGLFNGGYVSIPDTRSGDLVLIQVRIWDAIYSTYAEAFLSQTQFLGAYPVIGPITLGGGAIPVVRTSSYLDGALTLGPLVTNQLPSPYFLPVPMLISFSDLTSFVILADSHDSATIVLDASMSSDPDEDGLEFGWFEGEAVAPFALGEQIVHTFELGVHVVTLMVDDGTSAASMSGRVEVISAGEAVEALMAEMEATGLSAARKGALRSTLEAAAASFRRNQTQAGLNQLRAFANQVRALVTPAAPELADRLLVVVEEIEEALEPFGR